MPELWSDKLLGDVIELKRGYDLPSSKRIEGDTPIISSSGPSGLHNQAKIAAPGVVTGRYGTIGQVFYVTDDFWPLNTTLYVRDFKGNNPRFVSYFLRGIDFLAYSDKAAVPGVNRNHLHEAEVRVPDVDTQEEIVRVLASLDDKIELNRRMNETLEEMARALFRDWFVDFGPTRRQIEGATDPTAIMGQAFPPEKAATLAPLFPAKLGDDGLPEGWEKQRIKHALDRLNVGKLYNQKTALKVGEVPILDQGKFGVIGYHNNEPNIVASADGRVGIFANHTCVQRLLDHPFSTIQNVIPYRGKELPTEWCHYATLGQQSFEEYKGHWPTFVSKEIIKPPAEPASAFAEIVGSILLKVSANEKENQTLAEMRDLLLPKLMSGEIRLKDVEGLSE